MSYDLHSTVIEEAIFGESQTLTKNESSKRTVSFSCQTKRIIGKLYLPDELSLMTPAPYYQLILRTQVAKPTVKNQE